MKKPCPTKISGFTLIELLVVVSIIGILFGVGIAAYNQFNRRQILIQAAKTLKGDLRLAQSMALAGEKPEGCIGSLNGYQVSFTGNTYDIRAICPNAVSVKNVPLPTNVTFSGTPAAILFKVLAQGTNVNETQPPITLTAFGGTQTVTVTSSGDIY